MKKVSYGLFTTVAMIVGVVIGSGIFFKSDDILKHTGGNIFLGIVVFMLSAICVIFGSLAISTLAAKTDSSGGVVGYADQFCGRTIGGIFGWFFTFLYYPALTAIVAWVAGIYISMLFGIENAGFNTQLLIGAILFVVVFLYNFITPKLAGIFQTTSTVIKLIPLGLIAVFGMMQNNPITVVSENMQLPSTVQGLAWLAAIGPIAFSFDGWIAATSVSKDIKNAKRNLPIALIFSPIMILICYVAYFIGISSLMDPQEIIRLGNSHVDVIANNLFGPNGAKLILVFVVISVIGTVNGLTMALIRMPNALASKNMVPHAKKILTENDKKMPIYSMGIVFVLMLFWFAMHFITINFGLIKDSDISEIAVIFSYAMYVILYIKVIQLYKKGEVKGFGKGVVIPSIAILGSGVILFSAMQNPYFFPYFIIVAVVIIISAIFIKKLNPTVK